MAESRRGPGFALVLLSLLLAGACWFDAGSAGAFALLAQIPAALGIALLRGTRGKARMGRDALSLALLWGGAFLFAGLLVAWPLLALRSSAGLLPTLAMSGACAIVLLLLWRHWPLWHGIEREGGGLSARFASQDAHERGAWSGLQVAVPALLLLGGGIALAWPGLLVGYARSVATIAYAVLLPLAHALLQSAPERRLLHGLPVVEMDEVEADTAADANEADLVQAAPLAAAATIDVEALTRDLYAAARSGRVERALQLLDAGADARAAAPHGERDRRGLTVLAAVLPDLRLLRALIERGVDLNAAQAWTAPLLAATRDSWHGRPEAVMTLLANGADPRIVDAEGNTPLHHAARSSDPGVAALLRDAGAEMDALNGEGVSPLGTACIAGNWRRGTATWKRSNGCSSAAPSRSRKAGSRYCWPRPPPRKTMPPACNCCCDTRRGSMRATRMAAAPCTRLRWPAMRRSPPPCWMPAPTSTRATAKAARRCWKRHAAPPCRRWKPCSKRRPIHWPAMAPAPMHCTWRWRRKPRPPRW